MAVHFWYAPVAQKVYESMNTECISGMLKKKRNETNLCCQFIRYIDVKSVNVG